MKAITQRTYGRIDELEPEDVAMPSPDEGEVLVRVMAAAVNPGDLFAVMGKPYAYRLVIGPFTPRHPIPGHALAGIVESVGPNVSRFRVGDEVYAEIPHGAYAEHVSVREKALAVKPHNLTFEQAAAVPVSAVTALQGLRDKGQVQSGQRVLINGASGGVGTFAVQIAKALGAEVTAVCSTRNVDLVRSLGADDVVDYTREDFTKRPPHDVMLDVVGNRSLADCRHALAPDGRLVLASGPPEPVLRRMFAGFVQSPFVSQKIVTLAQAVRSEDLDLLTGMIESGSVIPVIDRVYPFHETAAALRYQADGHARGRTIVSIGSV